ncbi:MAG: cytochrome c [Pseudomonadota bacterium]|nr:cytochrome c [Pseudomonadota bacterium]
MGLDRNDYNRSGFWAFVFSMVFSFGFFIYISFIHKGVLGLDQPKLKVEVNAATAEATGQAPQEDVSKNTSPWISTPALVTYGKEKFATSCSVCHGNSGLGDGPASGTMNPKPRNLVEGKWTAGGTTIQLYKTVTGGLPGTAMAPFGHLSKLDRWAIVHFIRSVSKNLPKDDLKALEKFAQGEK